MTRGTTVEPCTCLLRAIRSTERDARSVLWRSLEWVFFSVNLVGSLISARLPVRDFSLGPMQLRLTTIARVVGIRLSSEARSIEARQVRSVLACARIAANPDLAMKVAAVRLAEALAFGERDGLPVIAAVARTYAGELPGPGHRPYATRLSAYFAAHRNACSKQCSLRGATTKPDIPPKPLTP